MWRVLLLASLFAVLGLGTAAYAECTSCLTSAFAERTSTSGTTTTVSLSFTARADDDASLPAYISGVVMQVDGQRTKCLSVTLPKTSGFPGAAVYSGKFSAYGSFSHSGRIDLAGQIYEFTVPLDGKPGTIALAADQSPLSQNAFRVVVTAAPVPVTPNPTVAPTRAGLELPRVDPAFLIGAGVVLVTVLGAYVDRRRALARSLAA